MFRAGVTLPLVVGLACGGGGGPTGPGRTAFGVVGASHTYLAIKGYNAIGASRGWPDPELQPYGGVGLFQWEAQIGDPSSQVWGIFRSLLEARPVSEIWWQIEAPAPPGPPPTVLTPSQQQDVTRVALEIRRLAGPNVPIFVSPIPDVHPSAECLHVAEESIQMTRLMADYAVAQGLAEPGPILRPITGENNGGPADPCHQGSVGQRQHGQDLRRFFGG